MSVVLISQQGRVGIVKLNRPRARNALSSALITELLHALATLDADSEVGAIVLTGEGTFCAGADIKELNQLTFVKAYMDKFLQNLNDGVVAVRKPIIAAVNGYALGGGCELAMMCDMIYAGESAKFGQPEVKIGTIPGAGGTQRLVRAIGKAKAMHMVLTGEMITAKEAETVGLVALVYPDDKVLDEAIKTAQSIASFSNPVIAMAKEAVNEADELNLREGLLFERRLYHATFGLEDSKVGMGAFLQKQTPEWKNA